MIDFIFNYLWIVILVILAVIMLAITVVSMPYFNNIQKN